MNGAQSGIPSIPKGRVASRRIIEREPCVPFRPATWPGWLRPCMAPVAIPAILPAKSAGIATFPSRTLPCIPFPWAESGP